MSLPVERRLLALTGGWLWLIERALTAAQANVRFNEASPRRRPVWSARRARELVAAVGLDADDPDQAADRRLGAAFERLVETNGREQPASLVDLLGELVAEDGGDGMRRIRRRRSPLWVCSERSPGPRTARSVSSRSWCPVGSRPDRLVPTAGSTGVRRQWASSGSEAHKCWSTSGGDGNRTHEPLACHVVQGCPQPSTSDQKVQVRGGKCHLWTPADKSGLTCGCSHRCSHPPK